MANEPSATAKDKDPKGGLSAAGRKKFGVKKGVTSYASASDETKKRWVRWALRFTKTPQPLKKPNGEPTRYALMFNAWGEPVPTSASAVRAVHAKAVSRAKTLKMGQYATSEKAALDITDEVDLVPSAEDELWLAEMALELAQPEEASESVLELRDRLMAAATMPREQAGENEPTDPAKWAKAKAAAKAKFTVYPSAYANAWAVQEYKRLGGGWREKASLVEDDDERVPEGWDSSAWDEGRETAAKTDGLGKWFAEKWVDISRTNSDGSHPACGRPTAGMSAGDYKKKYPKCVPAAKAKSMSSGDKKSATARKRDASNASSGGKGQSPKMVSTEKAELTLEIRDRLMPTFDSVVTREVALATPVVGSEVPPAAAATPCLVTEGRDRFTLTAPVDELAAPSEQASDMAKRLFVRLRGKFVEAEKANGNGAYWSAGDLEVGLPTVAYGPLNWLHDERKVVGVLSDARLVAREAAAATGTLPHITADATMWRWLYPQETRVVERAAEEKKLWYSMECVSPEVECVGEAGCGTKMPYLDALRREGAACQHVRGRTATRRFVDPVFQGGAIIVPPVTPGWASADLTVVREGASLLEATPWLHRDLDDQQAEQMVQQVLEYARRA